MASFDDDAEYLAPDFDPSSLTIPRLRAVLVAHDISYPSSAKKSELVDIFQQQLAPRAAKLRAARSRTTRTSKGITDVPSSHEGTVVGDDEQPPPEPPSSVRRSSGRSSMPPPPVSEPSTTGRRSKKTTSQRILEESPVRQITSPSRKKAERRTTSKHGRTSSSETGGELETESPPVISTRKTQPSAGRTSHVKPEPEETLAPARATASLEASPFSDNNPFQSGSPTLGATEPRRHSELVRSPRKKTTTTSTTTSRRRTDEPRRIKSEDGSPRARTSRTLQVPVQQLRARQVKADSESDDIGVGEEFTPEEQQALSQENGVHAGSGALTRRQRSRKTRRGRGSAVLIVLSTLMAGYAAWWRREKIAVGYCGLGRSTGNPVLADVQVPEWAEAFKPLMQPECEPCPSHALCYPDFDARCEADYVLQPHPLSLGGLWPLPPTCEPDGEKVRKIQAVADKAVAELRQRRADFECGTLRNDDGKPVTTAEIDEPTLKQDVSRKRRRGMSEAEFEDLWRGAIGEIQAREEVSSDLKGSLLRLRSSSIARLPIGCALRRSVRLTLARHRIALGLVLIILASVLYIRSLVQQRQTDRARVPALVATVLDRLATQAARAQNLGYSSPSSYQGRSSAAGGNTARSSLAGGSGHEIEPYISVGQMRDDVLRDEFSAPRRTRIWARVQAVVEANANVRASVQEGRHGEVSRVWQWIGALPAEWGNPSDSAWSSPAWTSPPARFSLGGTGGGTSNNDIGSRHQSPSPRPASPVLARRGSGYVSTPLREDVYAFDNSPNDTPEMITSTTRRWDEGRPIF